MEKLQEMYNEEVTPANEIKGFTKSFQKRTKDKREENKDIVELLGYQKENKIIIGAKVTEKAFKKAGVAKVFVAQNCDEFALKKVEHYAKVAGVEVVKLDVDKEELSLKMAKPFLISMVSVRA